MKTWLLLLLCTLSVDELPYIAETYYDDAIFVALTCLGLFLINQVVKCGNLSEPEVREMQEIEAKIINSFGKILKADLTQPGKTSRVIKGSFCSKNIAMRIIANKDRERGIRELIVLDKTRSLSQTMTPLFDFDTHGFIHILMPLYEYNLEQFLKSKPSRKKDDSLNEIVFQVAHALSALHELDIVHGNLKPSCIFLDCTSGSYRAILSNFGCSQVGKTFADIFGKVSQWSSPEVQNNITSKFSAKSDVFSFGLIAFEIWMCNVKKKTPTDISLSKRLFLAGKEMEAQVMEKMVEITPEDRISAKAMMTFPIMWTNGRVPLFFECLKKCMKRKTIQIKYEFSNWKEEIKPYLMKGMSKFTNYDNTSYDFIRFMRNLSVHHWKNSAFANRYKFERWIYKHFQEGFLKIVTEVLPQLDDEFYDDFFPYLQST